MANILVVDDDDGVRFSLEETLSRDGHHVSAVDSGQAALAKIAAQEFDLALLDLKLKDMTGLQVLGKLHERWPDTVAIILTGQASLETAVEALRQGAHDYLFKPARTVELRESVRTGLLKRQAALEARPHRRDSDHKSTSNGPVTSNGPITSNGPLLPTSLRPLTIPPTATAAQSSERFVQRGHLIVDAMRHVITLDGHLLELSPTEFDLLAYLAGEAPRVVSPHELVREVQNYDTEAWETTDTVRYHIYRLRHKIKEATGRSDVVTNVRGIGYTLGL
jgi:DNA-binding response OmpR family regulator